MATNSDYKQWPLRIHHHQKNWTISYHDPNGRIIHVLNADNQIGAFRAADKLIDLYQIDSSVILESDNGNRIIDVKKVMHYRN